jgi:hypothetical protein
MSWINGKSLRCALTVALLSFAAVPPIPAFAQEPYQLPPDLRPLPHSTMGYLDLRDAPVRHGLELVLGSYHADYSIGNEVDGFVTLKATGQTFEEQLRSIQRSVNIPLVYDTQDDVYLVKTPLTSEERSKRQAAFLDGLPKVAPRQQRNVVDVPRRVAGVWCQIDPQTNVRQNFAAILETGNPGPGADVEMVHVGSRVLSGVKRASDLTVVDIDTNGLTLETGEEPKQRITVPLANISRTIKETSGK